MGQLLWQRRLLLLVIGLLAVSAIAGVFIASGDWIGKPFPGFFLHANRTVGPYFLPTWSGDQSGLRTLDQVIAVDGTVLSDRAALYQRVKAAPAGTEFNYTVVREGRRMEVKIASMTLTVGDWALSFGVYVLMGIAFLVIGVAPYYFRSSSPAALPMCFMVLAVFAWFESTFDFVTAGRLPIDIRTLGLTLTPSAGIHLALLVKDGNLVRPSRYKTLLVLYGASLVLTIANRLTFDGPVDLWSVAFRAGYVYTCVGALIFLVLLGLALRSGLSDLERSRLRVIYGGAILGFLLPTACTVLTSSFGWPIPYNLALVPTLFFPISVTFALTKYSLFELGNALRVALSRIALMAALVLLYVMVVAVIVPRLGLYDSDPLIPLLFSGLVVIFFNPLLRWLEAAIDRLLFRQEYDPVQVQEEVSLYLRTLTTLPDLMRGFVERIRRLLAFDNVIVAYRPKGAESYLIEGIEAASVDQGEIGQVAAVLADSAAPGHRFGISRGEIISNPQFGMHRGFLLDRFAGGRIEIFIPLVFESHVYGYVAVGPKRSRREYTAEDLRLIGTLTEQLALSLENARLFDELARAYDRAESSMNKLLEMDRIKKNFVANICHELRTPVSTIIGYSEVLLDPSFQGNGRAILERLVNNGQELSELMDNLMNYTRIEADSAAAQFELVKLKEILNGVEMMTQRLIRQRPIRFGVNLETDIDVIESDGQKVQQILVQLLTNALKFTEKGIIEVRIRTVEHANSPFLEIAVADTGIGIKKEDQDLIFEDFRQLDGSASRHYGGTGLGLSLCKKLAAALGGDIRVDSEYGVGSVFSLLLPITPATTAGGAFEAVDTVASIQ